MSTTPSRSYSGLIQLPTFLERYNYLKLNGIVGDETFGFERYLNQRLYVGNRWRSVRDKVIVRDNGMDLGVEGYPISGHIYVHHMNPITIEDLESGNEDIFNPEYLICVSKKTHDAIHYGDENLIPKGPAVRYPNDQCPWK